MLLEWSATTPETTQVSPVVTRSDLQKMADHFTVLRSLGEGFLEVSLTTQDSPQLALGFRGDHAVVEQLRTLDQDPTTFLLVGDGSVPWDSTVELPGPDGNAIFTGYFVMSVDRAWSAVDAFLRKGSPTILGEWYQL